jgi:hypothetical protein
MASHQVVLLGGTLLGARKAPLRLAARWLVTHLAESAQCRGGVSLSKLLVVRPHAARAWIVLPLRDVAVAATMLLETVVCTAARSRSSRLLRHRGRRAAMRLPVVGCLAPVVTHAGLGPV